MLLYWFTELEDRARPPSQLKATFLRFSYKRKGQRDPKWSAFFFGVIIMVMYLLVHGLFYRLLSKSHCCGSEMLELIANEEEALAVFNVIRFISTSILHGAIVQQHCLFPAYNCEIANKLGTINLQSKES